MNMSKSLIGLMASAALLPLMAAEAGGTGGEGATTSETSTKSIIGDKYKGMYRGASDWIGSTIEEKCLRVPEGAKEGSTARDLHLPDLFRLARANKLNEEKIAKMESQQGERNAPGRIRMTIGNMLRAAAKRRHGLYDVDGASVLTPDAEFMLGAPDKPTEDLDGNKIVDPEVEKKKAEAKADREAKAAQAKADKEAKAAQAKADKEAKAAQVKADKEAKAAAEDAEKAQPETA